MLRALFWLLLVLPTSIVEVFLYLAPQPYWVLFAFQCCLFIPPRSTWVSETAETCVSQRECELDNIFVGFLSRLLSLLASSVQWGGESVGMTPLAYFCFFTPNLDALGLSSLQCEPLFLSYLASTLPSFSIYLLVSSSEIYVLGQSDF